MLIAIRTQSWFRGARVRGELAREHLAATTIQKQTRAMLATKQYHCVLRGIITFQAVAQMFLLCTAFVRHRIVRRALLLATSVTVIQSAIQGCLQRMAYAQMPNELRSAVTIQSQYGGVIAASASTHCPFEMWSQFRVWLINVLLFWLPRRRVKRERCCGGDSVSCSWTMRSA